MGASDPTTEALKTGNGEVVDGDRPAASIGHAAKKRKRQKARAAVASNGHVSKVALRKAAGSSGGVVVDEPEDAATPQAPVEELDDIELDGATVEAPDDELVDVRLHRATVEAPVDDDLVDVKLHGATVESRDDDELGDAEPAADDGPPADGGRRARKRAAKRAKADAGEAAPRGGAAKRARAGIESAPRGAAKRATAANDEKAPRKRAKAARLATPAARRATLVATAAEIAAAVAAAEEPPAHIGRKRAAKVARRMFALIAIAMIPASAYALVVTDGPSTSLSRADASYMSAQLMTADQRVRRQLARLRARQTSSALARTRDAVLTARSLALELANTGGTEAKLLRRALKLESAWLDAVGSVLSNPRSPLRGALVARDALLRPALDALPVPEGRRKGGAKRLVRYAKSRASAARRR